MHNLRELRSFAPRRPVASVKVKRSKSVTFITRSLLSFFRSTQTHGYKFLVQPNRPKCEIVFWMMALVSVSAFTLWLVLYVYIPILSKPTVTKQSPFLRSVNRVPFPTIAFCSMNRISRVALMNYSEFIFTEQKKFSVSLGKTTEEVYENLRPLGLVYQTFLDTPEMVSLEPIHSALLKIYGGPYPLRELIDDIAPKCPDLIRHCVWRGRIIECEEHFNPRHSFIGSCCYFNYIRPRKNEVLNFKRKRIPFGVAEPVQVSRVGYDYGLTVVVDQRVHDYCHTVDAMIGTNIYLIDPMVYLDELSGTVTSRLLAPNEELFMSVDPIIVTGSERLRPHHPHLRGCYFPDETKLDKMYSRSECILDCRMQDVIKMCGCLPVAYSNNLYDARDCLLNDMHCLAFWVKYWIRSRDRDTGAPEKIAEPKCPHCLKECNYMKYVPSTSKANFNFSKLSQMAGVDNFTNIHNMRDHSIVHINYQQNRYPQFEHTVAYMWFDLFGMFGGLCGLLFGGSIISVIELIYYGTGRFGVQFTRRICGMRSTAKGNNNQSVSSSTEFSPATRPPTVSIYFNELVRYKKPKVEKRMPLRRHPQKKFNAALIELP